MCTLARRRRHHGWRAAALLALAVALLAFAPTVVLAQDAIRLASLQVSIWPEYDRPTALIILDGRLAETVPLPASLAIRIPARASSPHAVAVTDEAGQLLSVPYTSQPAGDDIMILFQTQTLGFRVEYYDPSLSVEGEARRFDFDWQVDYAIDMALARVQQPRDARDLAGEPALTALGAGQDGLDYHELRWGAAAPGDSLRLSLTYAKAGTGLTAAGQGSVPQPQTAPTAAAGRSTLPWIVVGTVLGLALVGAGVYAYLRRPLSERPRAVTRTRRPRSAASKRVRPRAAGPAAAGASAGFCTQCGQPRRADDRFCRRCGAPLSAG